MRAYEQFCALSKSLDVVGGRWTLLIVRELLLGPRRFSDLRAALPGIANNLLAQRLRELEADGLARRRALPGPGDVQVYELTERGQALDEVVFALMRWGAEYMTPSPRDFFRPEWLALVLRAYLPRRVARGLRLRLAVVVEPVVISVRAGGGSLRVEPVAAEGDVDAVLEADPHALLAVASGAEPLRAARRRGAVRLSGGRDAQAAVATLFEAVSPR